MPYPSNLHINRCMPDGVLKTPRRHPQLVEVIILKSELLHDIESDVHRIERMRKMEETPIIQSDADYYDISRDIDTALGEVVKRCVAYLLLPSPYTHRISTNHVNTWEETSIYLALPDNWPPHDIDPLRNAIHDYIVKAEELELLTISMPDDKYLPKLELKKMDLYDDINVLLNDRLGGKLIQTTFLG